MNFSYINKKHSLVSQDDVFNKVFPSNGVHNQ